MLVFNGRFLLVAKIKTVSHLAPIEASYFVARKAGIRTTNTE
jgi:hypothetical protein